VRSIITHCKQGDWILVASSVIERELLKLRDADRLKKVQNLYSVATEWVEITSTTEQRSAELQLHGVKRVDSLHVALAEMCGAVFLTTDDRLLRAVNGIGCKAYNPAIWLMEILK